MYGKIRNIRVMVMSFSSFRPNPSRKVINIRLPRKPPNLRINRHPLLWIMSSLYRIPILLTAVQNWPVSEPVPGMTDGLNSEICRPVAQSGFIRSWANWWIRSKRMISMVTPPGIYLHFESQEISYGVYLIISMHRVSVQKSVALR